MTERPFQTHENFSANTEKEHLQENLTVSSEDQ